MAAVALEHCPLGGGPPQKAMKGPVVNSSKRMQRTLPVVLFSLCTAGGNASAQSASVFRSQAPDAYSAAAVITHFKRRKGDPVTGFSSTGRKHQEVRTWRVVSRKMAEPVHSHLHLAAINASMRSASSLMTKHDDSDLCGCRRDDVCSCEAQFNFLECVQKNCAAKKCDCPDPDVQIAELCSASSLSCKDDLNITCGKEQEHSCKGRFHQAHDGVVGFVLNTETLGDQAYCGPFGKCQGELQVVAQIHRGYQGMWLECQVKDGDEFTRCESQVIEKTTTCRMPMVPALPVGKTLVGKCRLTEGKNGPDISQNGWFTVANRHKAANGGAVGARNIAVMLLSTLVCAAGFA